MNIGILSDTHGWLHPSVKRHFNGFDEIWHAGDIGSIEVIRDLEKICPVVRCVYGNIDNQEVRADTTENLHFKCGGLWVTIIHIANKPPKYNSETLRLIENNHTDILVCGHSHILKIMHDHMHKLLYINPGAAGYHGFHKRATLVQFKITDGQPTNMEVIDLGPRGKLLVR